MGPNYSQISETAGYVNHLNEYIILINAGTSIYIIHAHICVLYSNLRNLLTQWSNLRSHTLSQAVLGRSSLQLLQYSYLLSRGRTKCFLFFAEPLELAITFAVNSHMY